jgi:hypothetical protein
MPSSKYLLTLCATLAAGCAAVKAPQTGFLTPPAELMADCPAPQGSAATNGDLVQWILDLRASLADCNNDKASLRDWSAHSQEAK